MSASNSDRKWFLFPFQMDRYLTTAQTADFAALCLRLVLGGLFFMHLYRKFFYAPMGGIGAWWGALEHNGYPVYVRVYVLTAEFAAMILLPLGIMTRLTALYAVPMMLGATMFWWNMHGYWFSDSGAEFPIVWTLSLLVMAVLGSGKFALMPARNP
jgi:putative oxidoreductase